MIADRVRGVFAFVILIAAVGVSGCLQNQNSLDSAISLTFDSRELILSFDPGNEIPAIEIKGAFGGEGFDVFHWNDVLAGESRGQIVEHNRVLGDAFVISPSAVKDNYLVLPYSERAEVSRPGLFSSRFSRFQEDDAFINVRDHGAKGDGSTEDTGAFQSAMNEARHRGGGWVFVPTGEYPIRRVEVFSNTIISGEGRASVLMHAAENLDENPETSIMLTNAADNVIWKNLMFHGNLAAHSYSWRRRWRPGNANSELLDLRCGSNIVIYNNYFVEGLAGDVIDLDGAWCSFNYFIVGNHIDMTAHRRTGEGILARGEGHVIANNIVIGSNSRHRAAIAVDSGSRENWILNNRVQDSARAFDIRIGAPGSEMSHIMSGNKSFGGVLLESVFDGVCESH